MHKFKKRCLSTTLGLLVTAANTLGCFSANSFGNVSTLTAKAASTSNAQANSLSAIGIDTTKAPEGYDEYDDSNPYGMNVVTPKPVSELLIADDETGTSSKLYGHDKSFNAGNLQNTFLENPIENGSNIFNKPLTDDVYLPSDAKEAYAENIQMSFYSYCNKEKIKETAFISMAGLKPTVPKRLQEQGVQIISCVDNDDKGRKFEKENGFIRPDGIKKALDDKGFKDWNELLVFQTEHPDSIFDKDFHKSDIEEKSLAETTQDVMAETIQNDDDDIEEMGGMTM